MIGIHLFGSVARDEPTGTSDVDVLAVIANDAELAEVDDRLLGLVSDVGLEDCVPIEVHVMVESAFVYRKDKDDPFVLAVIGAGEVLV